MMIDIGVNFAGRTYNREKIRGLLDVFKRSGGDSVISISNSIREIGVNMKLSEHSVAGYSSVSGFACPLYYTAGCHPHHAKEMKVSDYNVIRSSFSPAGMGHGSSSTISHPAQSYCVAVGEMGLDYNRMFSPKEVQIEVFRQQVRIAKELRRPMYLHVRDAFEDFINIIREEEYSCGVVHCFTGTLSQAETLINYGFKLGITGWLLDTRRNADLMQVVASPTVPLECLMVETDAPYMSMSKVKKLRQKEAQATAAAVSDCSSSSAVASSVSAQKKGDEDQSAGMGKGKGKGRGKPSHESEPADIAMVLEEVARLKGMSLETCTATIFTTTKELFQLQ